MDSTVVAPIVASSDIENRKVEDVLVAAGINSAEALQLSEACLNAKDLAYCPYSKFPVGCSILLSTTSKAREKLIIGANVENAAFPVGTCAERVAMGTAITQGMKFGEVKAIGVAANTDDFCSPCGMCRQFLKEFCLPETPIIMHNRAAQRKVVTMKELLPHSFDVHMLGQAISPSKVA